MMDFPFLPPEINSARMYAGAGAAPLNTAAYAWAGLSAELMTAARDHATVVANLSEAWTGPSSVAMADTAARYMSWLITTAECATNTALQAHAAVSAYEAAFVATVPPMLIAANRARLAVLVATNFLGVNTPAIMMTETEYAEYWAADVSAMTEYQLASAQATVLPTFSPLGALSRAVSLPGGSPFAPGSGNSTRGLSGLINLFSGSSNSAFGNALNSNFLSGTSNFDGNVLSAFGGTGLANPGSTIGPFAALGQQAQQQPTPDPTPQVWPIPQPPQPSPAPVPSASLGKALAVGNLSVPQSWARSVPGAFSNPEQITPLNEAPFVGVPGVPLLGGSRGKAEPARYGFPAKLFRRHTAGG